ncbi:hypothetical protein IKP85_03305 [bacterium]|nr:hypothetical protein [bacterium]
MYSKSIQSYETPFCASYSIRGSVKKISSKQYHQIKDLCVALGTRKDKIDIFIPDPEKHPGGVIPMAVCLDGNLMAFVGVYKNSDILGGVINGLNFARNRLFPKEFEKVVTAQKVEV